MAVINTQRGTAAALTATNPVIADGQIVYETDTGRIKIGDGVTAWTNLRYGSTAVYAYTSTASFPGTGTAAVIYLATDSGRAYRWDSSGVYVEIGPVGSGVFTENDIDPFLLMGL